MPRIFIFSHQKQHCLEISSWSRTPNNQRIPQHSGMKLLSDSWASPNVFHANILSFIGILFFATLDHPKLTYVLRLVPVHDLWWDILVLRYSPYSFLSLTEPVVCLFHSLAALTYREFVPILGFRRSTLIIRFPCARVFLCDLVQLTVPERCVAWISSWNDCSEDTIKPSIF